MVLLYLWFPPPGIDASVDPLGPWYLLLKNHSRVNGPSQSKPVLFNGQGKSPG